MKKIVSYKNVTIVFVLVIIFVISVSVILLSQRTDNVENRMNKVEKRVYNIGHHNQMQ